MSIFSAVTVLHAGLDIRLYYLIIAFNLPWLLLRWRLSVPKTYLIILTYIWISGLIEVAFGPDTLPKYLMEAVGISVVSFYFYIFFATESHSIVEIFDRYAKACVYVTSLGIVLTVVESLAMGYYVPVKSVLPEPAAYATVVLPCFYYYASSGKTYRHRQLYMWTILTGILLSVSSVGVLGLFLSIVLLLRRKSRTLFVAPLLVGILFFATYAGSGHFRMRVDDTVQSLSAMDVSNANLSTYALVSNAYVAIRAFEERPFFGYGVGGHVIAHAKYIDNLPGVEAVGDLIDLNAQDANSLFLRTMSEFGLIGIVFVIVFLVYSWTPGQTVYSNVSASVFVYLCLKLLRGGHWFGPELYFFVWTYVLVAKQAKSDQVGYKKSALLLLADQ
ncbi:MAG: O-antigen ligase family protein [Acidobacteriaceae bacterium]